MSKASLATEKLQKMLAARGFGSRREIEKWIVDGRVRVNGKRATLGDRACDSDAIELDGRKISHKPQTHRVILYHKKEGEISSRKDERNRPTVFDHLPRLSGQRWINIGRLDINTSGLFLFTTDGALANRLMHPSAHIDREYLVRVFGEVTGECLNHLRNGVELEDGIAKFSDITEKERSSPEGRRGQNKWFTVCLMEGRNREVRRLWESQDVQVNRLKRVRYGPILLPSYVRAGQWVDLGVRDTRMLYNSCDMKPPELSLKDPRQRLKAVRQEQKIRSGGRGRSRNRGPSGFSTCL